MAMSRVKKILIAIGVVVVIAIVSVVGLFMVLANSMSHEGYLAVLNLESAELVTPDQTYPLVAKEVAHSERDYRLENPLILIGGPKDLEIKFSPVYPALQILHPQYFVHRGQRTGSITNRNDVSFPEGVSWYQLNDQDRVPFQYHVNEHNRTSPDSPRSVYFTAERPEPLAGFRLQYSGGSLFSDAVEKIKETTDDVHRYHLYFLVGDQPHEINVAFRLQLQTRRIFGVPGMP